MWHCHLLRGNCPSDFVNARCPSILGLLISFDLLLAIMLSSRELPRDATGHHMSKRPGLYHSDEKDP
eukprot:scaffold843_cov330-Pavlova_lutheri.AAC.7